MNNKKKIDKWIDLSTLPRRKNGDIEWKKSIGKVLPFIYDGICGELKLLKYVGNHQYMALITTDEYSVQRQIFSSHIKDCRLGWILEKPIYETNPELVKYFANKNDAFQYSAHSTERVDMICPICGTLRKQQIYVLTDRGFSCPMCGDGFSYPEKFMYNILTQLKLNFKNQITKATPGFEWIKYGYRYDFYIEFLDENFFIEMDGGLGHGNKTFHGNNDNNGIQRDIIKDQMALEHNIQTIRIDCNYVKIQQRFEYIKSNILVSKLNMLVDFSYIDWDKANIYALGSNIKLAADAWNNGAFGAKEVGKIIGVSRHTAVNYLKTANRLGMCNYNDSEIENRRVEKIKQTVRDRNAPIALIKDDKIIDVFRGPCDLASKSEALCGKYIYDSNVRAVLKGNKKHVNGYDVKYISENEYEQYKINESLRKEENYEAS